MRVTARAHAKINWSLGILSARADGYHELDMLMQTLELHDDLILEPDDGVTLTCDDPAVPVDGSNLVVRAALALAEEAGVRRGARMRLVKRIPSRAGLGGGSSDCAAALTALDRLWGLGTPPERLMALGRSLGADVPFCLQGGLSRVRGIGERLQPLSPAPEVPLVLVTPGGGLSTGGVFRAWDQGAYPPARPVGQDLIEALTSFDPARAQALSFNSLEAPAISLMPQIADVMEALRAEGARMVRMSGSGSTVFAVFESGAAARRAAGRFPGAIATRTRAAQGVPIECAP